MALIGLIWPGPDHLRPVQAPDFNLNVNLKVNAKAVFRPAAASIRALQASAAMLWQCKRRDLCQAARSRAL